MSRRHDLEVSLLYSKCFRCFITCDFLFILLKDVHHSLALDEAAAAMSVRVNVTGVSLGVSK